MAIAAQSQSRDPNYYLPEPSDAAMSESSLTIPVLLGSVRPERQALRAGRMVAEALRVAGHEAVMVDPLELRLPLLERTYAEYMTGEAPAGLDGLAALYRRADGFVVVSGEYNHGIPPALKNLLDYFLKEYLWRPSGIVCYSSGQFGGVRAAMQLRMTLSELGMPSIPTLLPIPRIASAIDEAGRPRQDWLAPALNDFIAEFAWYAHALKQGRVGGTPY
jgi:NAD(P)H-dependent FMN reductase